MRYFFIGAMGEKPGHGMPSFVNFGFEFSQMPTEKDLINEAIKMFGFVDVPLILSVSELSKEDLVILLKHRL